MADLKKLAEELSKLTVLEAAELVKTLEAEWGVSAAAPVAVAAAGAGPAAAEEVEEKTEFDVVLKYTPRKLSHQLSATHQPRPGGSRTMAETAGKKLPRLARKPPMKPRRNWKKPAQLLSSPKYFGCIQKTAEQNQRFFYCTIPQNLRMPFSPNVISHLLSAENARPMISS
jgi:large subunit ribosomal protein L7/L12